MSVRTSVRPSTKSFFDFDEIWYTGSTRWVMHNGMTLTRIQGQGHRPEICKITQIQSLSPSPKFAQSKLRLMVDYYTTGQYLKFNWSDFWNSSSFFVTWPRNFGPNDVWQVIFLSLCDIYQTWYTGSTRWEMHNGMCRAPLSPCRAPLCPSPCLTFQFYYIYR